MFICSNCNSILLCATFNATTARESCTPKQSNSMPLILQTQPQRWQYTTQIYHNKLVELILRMFLVSNLAFLIVVMLNVDEKGKNLAIRGDVCNFDEIYGDRD